MKISIPRRQAVMLAAGVTAGLAAPRRQASAAEYPNRPLRIIVPYTPGGFTDLSTRLVSEPLSRALGQPVAVENRPGANSILGVQATATSPADGYTFVTVLPAHAANATLQAGRLTFDAVRSFSPVSVIALSPLVLAGSSKLQARTLREMIAYAKANPGRVTAGVSGVGTITHLLVSRVTALTGATMEHVPYRGGTPALLDIMAGNVDL